MADRILCKCDGPIMEECRLTVLPDGSQGWHLGGNRSQRWLNFRAAQGQPGLALSADFPEIIPPCARRRLLQLSEGDVTEYRWDVPDEAGADYLDATPYQTIAE